MYILIQAILLSDKQESTFS